MISCAPGGPVVPARTVVIAPGSSATVAVPSDPGATIAIHRLLFGANGAGASGLEGLVLTGARIDNRYLTGGLLATGGLGAATAEVSLLALDKFFRRTRLDTGIVLTPGYDLLLTIRNEAAGPRYVSIADDRQAHGQPYATKELPRLYAYTTEIPAGAVRYEVDLPRGAEAGALRTLALAATQENALRVSLLVGRARVMEGLYPEQLDALLALSGDFPALISVPSGERLSLEVDSTAAAPVRLSVFGELTGMMSIMPVPTPPYRDPDQGPPIFVPEPPPPPATALF